MHHAAFRPCPFICVRGSSAKVHTSESSRSSSSSAPAPWTLPASEEAGLDQSAALEGQESCSQGPATACLQAAFKLRGRHAAWLHLRNLWHAPRSRIMSYRRVSDALTCCYDGVSQSNSETCRACCGLPSGGLTGILAQQVTRFCGMM